MDFFYYTLLTILDIIPWVFFQLFPFRKDTKYSMKFTFVFIPLVCIVYKLIIAYNYWITPYCAIVSFCLQSFSAVLATLLLLFFINANKYKICFVCLLTIPCSAFTASVGTYVGLLFAESPQRMFIMFISRLLITIPLGCYYFHFEKKYFPQNVPFVTKKENELWKYAWYVPATLVVTSLLIYLLEVFEGDMHFFEILVQLFLCLSVFFICSLFLDCLRYARGNIIEKHETEKIELLLSLQQKLYQDSIEDFERIRRNNHDFRHHLATLNTYASEENYDTLRQYILDLSNVDNEYQQQFFCKNVVINAILVSNYKKAVEHNIQTDIKVSLMEDIDIAPLELSLLFGNIFENAIEASLFLPEKDRNIQLKAKLYANKLYLLCINNYSMDRIKDNKLLLSSKRNYFTPGIGLMTIRHISDKYNGDVDIECEKGVFTIKVVIPVKDRD